VFSWIVSLAAGIALAAIGYVGRGPWRSSRWWPAALRVLAGTLLVALVLDAPLGPARPGNRLLALDASASLARGGTAGAWAAARRAADSIGGRPVLAGDRPADAPVPEAPTLPLSRVSPLVERARTEGRAVTLITDGELDDPDALTRLPTGSRVRIVRGEARPDVALVSLDVPAVAVVGDTMAVTAQVVAGDGGSSAAVLTVLDDQRPLGTVPVPALAAREERSFTWRGPVPPAGARQVTVALRALTDAEGRNDTLRTVVEVLAQPTALVVSTRPDADARWLDAGVRAALGDGVRTWWRVAPGEWRESPRLTPVAEADVRRAVAAARVLVLHGDTAYFGPPAQVTRAARWLVAPPEGAAEWYVSPAPRSVGSPLGDVLANASLDSLPPLAAAPAPALEWTAVAVRRNKQGTDVPVLTGRNSAPRVAVLSAAGFSRWGLRGGEAADALPAMAGAVAAWLAESAPDGRAAVPAAAAWREGERVSWRRTGRDSVVVLSWTRVGEPRGATARGTDTLRFSGTQDVVAGPAWPEGQYAVRVAGGDVRVVVNPSREWVPRAPTVGEGPVGTASASAMRPTARGAMWLVAVVLAALCAEWLLRRRAGLR
jgi:hypothetical protein